MLKHIHHSEIDKKKWDAKVASIPYTPFYFLYDYLSSICNWNAIVIEVENEYSLILPLPFQTKFGLKYLYQPFFCQQLGPLFDGGIDKKTWSDLSKSIKNNYLYGTMQWSENQVSNPVFFSEKRVNLTLPLGELYNVLELNYNKNRKRVLKRLKQEDYIIECTEIENDINLCIDDFCKQLGGRFENVKEENYDKLKYALSKISNTAKLYVVKVILRGETCSEVLFVEFNHRITYLLAYTVEAYTSTGVGSLIVDVVIKNNQHTTKKIDFEGGEIEGIAKFYKSFGAKEENYHKILLRSWIDKGLKIVRLKR